MFKNTQFIPNPKLWTKSKKPKDKIKTLNKLVRRVEERASWKPLTFKQKDIFLTSK
jgi:hypothetical protein